MIQVYWYRKNRHQQDWSYNHRDLECPYGATEPVPISDYQRKMWAGAQWKREYIDD